MTRQRRGVYTFRGGYLQSKYRWKVPKAGSLVRFGVETSRGLSSCLWRSSTVLPIWVERGRAGRVACVCFFAAAFCSDSPHVQVVHRGCPSGKPSRALSCGQSVCPPVLVLVTAAGRRNPPATSPVLSVHQHVALPSTVRQDDASTPPLCSVIAVIVSPSDLEWVPCFTQLRLAPCTPLVLWVNISDFDSLLGVIPSLGVSQLR